MSTTTPERVAGIPRDEVRASITRAEVVLVAASCAMQVVALTVLDGRLEAGSTGRFAFSTIEMAFVVALVAQGWRLVVWSRRPGRDPLVAVAARWCLASLVLCALGDLVNRNFPQRSFEFDEVLRHSYLVTSIWFFLPGYAIVVAINRRVSRGSVSAARAAATVLVGAALGLIAAFANAVPGLARYPSTMIAAYTVVLATLAASTVWLVVAYGWRPARVVVAGCLLAVLADALIGSFWIATDHYPTIEHVNWIPYFASLAMIQRLPFLVADHHPTKEGPSAGPA